MLLPPLDPSGLRDLIDRCRREDLGPALDDVTSRLLIPPAATTVARIVSRQAGVLSGAVLLRPVLDAYDRDLRLTVALSDGSPLSPGSVIAEIAGSLRSVLAAERVALNFLTHLSGVATGAAEFVRELAKPPATKAVICDTRKTLPGLRALEKYAVACGGGTNHRMGLHDAVLVKDNHIAHIPLERLTAELTRLVAAARAQRPALRFVEIEVDTLAQLGQALPAGPDCVLLDNMGLDTLRAAVAMRDRLAPSVLLEASGGVRLETVRAIAETGVDRVSAGALTHSARYLDIGMDIGD